jgi:hypothetical protein
MSFLKLSFGVLSSDKSKDKRWNKKITPSEEGE